VPRREHELRLYAHRGASAHLPENTLGAFSRALEDGADALELDVHRTADEVFVVAHDPDGRRIAGLDRRIREATADEVRRWPLGGADPIPTLAEVLEAFPGVPMSVDLKPHDRTAVAPLVELVAAHGGEDHVTLASFHDGLVRQMRRIGWRGRTALTRGEVAAVRLLPPAVARGLVRGDAAQLPRRVGALRLDGRRFIATCRRLGLRVDYWVVNREEEARTLLERGATGVMTDDPRAVAPAFGRDPARRRNGS
jgi:glycerophosphoryl diester phosphodiesterase